MERLGTGDKQSPRLRDWLSPSFATTEKVVMPATVLKTLQRRLSPLGQGCFLMLRMGGHQACVDTYGLGRRI